MQQNMDERLAERLNHFELGDVAEEKDGADEP